MLGKLREGKKLLIVSLPRNDEALAGAALEGGADALKVHLNVSHRASGTQFGTFEEERGKLEKIAAMTRGRAELGIMPGAVEAHAAVKDLNRLAEMGFTFLDIYAHDMPVQYLKVRKLEIMAALGHGPDRTWRLWKHLGAGILEASVVDPELYGKPLTLSDLAAYKEICAESGLPVVVPTQKKIRADEVGLLFEAGVSAVMIGAIAAGRTPESILKGTREFRAAIDAWTGKSRGKKGREHPGFGVA